MSGCKKNDDLKIDYHAQGQYGENILDKANKNYPVGSTSMRVVLGDNEIAQNNAQHGGCLVFAGPELRDGRTK
jgi:hypothetical protein